jgi:hypothetical protein
MMGATNNDMLKLHCCSCLQLLCVDKAAQPDILLQLSYGLARHDQPMMLSLLLVARGLAVACLTRRNTCIQPATCWQLLLLVVPSLLLPLLPPPLLQLLLQGQ